MLTEMAINFFTDETVIFVSILTILMFGCIIGIVRFADVLSTRIIKK